MSYDLFVDQMPHVKKIDIIVWILKEMHLNRIHVLDWHGVVLSIKIEIVFCYLVWIWNDSLSISFPREDWRKIKHPYFENNWKFCHITKICNFNNINQSDIVGLCKAWKISPQLFVELARGLDCSQPLYLRARKQNRAKRAQSTQGWGGVCERSVQDEVLRCALAPSSLAILSARLTSK